MTTFTETEHPRSAGGQFREKTHTEAPLSLTRDIPELVDMAAFSADYRQSRNSLENQLVRIENQLSELHMNAARVAARAAFPDATELRLNSFVSERGTMQHRVSSVRAEGGSIISTDSTDHPAWHLNSDAEVGTSVALAISRFAHSSSRGISRFLDEHEGVEYDPSSDEWVIYLDGSISTEARYS